MRTPFHNEAEIAIRAAKEAGDEALTYYDKPGLSIRDKGRDNPVTEADLRSNEIILAALTKHFPKDGIRSEETHEHEPPDSKKRLWLVDPLDGTKDFVRKTGEFSVMIGLAIEGKAVLGVVYCPVNQKLCVGVPGHGAFWVKPHGEKLMFEPLKVPDRSVPSTIRVVSSRHHNDPKVDRLLKELSPVERIACGSVGVKCLLVAEDTADLYVHPVALLKEWDTCAPEALVRGAGGLVTDCLGNELTYGKVDPRQPLGIFVGRPAVYDRAKPHVVLIAKDIGRRGVAQPG